MFNLYLTSTLLQLIQTKFLEMPHLYMHVYGFQQFKIQN